jgi:hypothetical protein
LIKPREKGPDWAEMAGDICFRPLAQVGLPVQHGIALSPVSLLKNDALLSHIGGPAGLKRKLQYTLGVKHSTRNVVKGTSMAQEKCDKGTSRQVAFAPTLHNHTTSMRTTANYCRRPLGSNGRRAASTSRQVWGLGAVGAGSQRTTKYTAATVGSYRASKSMEL